MPSISSGYGQGTSFTNTQGPSGMDVSPYLMALLQAEQRHLSQRAPGRSGPIIGPAVKQGAALRPIGPGREGDKRSLMQDRLLEAQAAKASAEAKALNSRIPTRIHPGGAGYTGAFSTPDHLAMTGAQRAVFLPNNSELVGRIGELSPEDQDFLIRMRNQRERGVR